MSHLSKLNKAITRNLSVSRWVASRNEISKFIVVASILVGNQVFTRTNSSEKTSPHQKKYFADRGEKLHAEINLLKRFLGEDVRGPLLVTRYSKNDDEFKMSKPCPSCQRFIDDHFPRLEIWYSNRLGSITKLKR